MILLLALACAGDDGTGTDALCDGAPVTTYDNFGAGFLTANCETCHAASAPDRHDAPADATFDDEEQVWAWADAILDTATGDAPTMPPQGGVEDDDRYRLEVWLRCGG
ncbi:MAG: hypothetical protein H6738_16460 [Alphaproteobacteria bacterium]|nr:hypothetical protein [Alphaproteobacteria bacterium]MCB9698374.1 hypothetical protein [Alphaproteobacteria bacterium]